MSSGITDNNNLLIKKRSPNNNNTNKTDGSGSSRPSSSGGGSSSSSSNSSVYNNNSDKVISTNNNGLYSKHNVQLLNNKKSLNSKLFMKPSVIHHPASSNLRPFYPSNKPTILSSHDSSSSSLSLQRPPIFASSEDEEAEEVIPESTHSSTTTASSDNLTSTLLIRLKKLEQVCAEQKTMISSKDQQVKELQRTIEKQRMKMELLVAEKGKKQSTINTIIKFMDNAGLQHSFKSLSTDDSTSITSSGTTSNSSSSSVKPELPINHASTTYSSGGEESRKSPKPHSDDDLGSRINMKVLEQRVTALNKMVDEEELVEVSKNGNIKQLKPKPICRVTFWKNGIVVEGGPFKPYKWDITKAFLTDILDGYFPYEFKEKHPDGVKLKIVDKTSEDYSRQVERTVGMDTYLKQNEGSNIRGMDYLKHVEENGKEQPLLDKKSLLDKLPKQVIKNGKVISIREEIEKVISKEQPQPSQESQPAIIEIHEDDDSNNQNPKELCTIKLKSSTKQFIITIHKSKTIDDLRNLLLTHIGHNSFRLKAIPNTFFDDSSLTLEQGKLFPKAILMLLDG